MVDKKRPSDESKQSDVFSPYGDGDQTGFGESPQASFEGAPVDISSTSISEWADEISKAEDLPPSARIKKPELGKMGPGTDKQVPANKEDKKPKKPKALKTSRGTSMGGPASAKERAAGGLNPVPGLDVSLEDAEKLTSTTGATATVEALSQLIEHGREEIKGDVWICLLYTSPSPRDS